MRKLLDNAKVKRFFHQRHPEILEELQQLAAVRTPNSAERGRVRGLGVRPGVQKLAYTHAVIIVDEKRAHELMPRTHRVISPLKRWLLGAHQSAVGHKHLE